MAKPFARRLLKIIFIGCNGIASLLLLLGCYGNAFEGDFYWMAGLCTLASLYLLLLVVAFLCCWLFIRPSLAWISLLTIIACWKPLQQAIPFRIGSSFVSKKDSSQIRVMSWNVEHFDILEHKTHPEKKQEMIDLINEMSPDVACFQEMVASDSALKAINYLPDFVSQLQMKGYYYSYNKKLDFDSKHRFGIIVFSKLPIVRKETISLDPKNYNSIFQYVDVVKNKDTIRVFNIHLQSLKFSADNILYIEDPTMTSERDLEKSKNVLAKFKVGFLKRKKQSDFIKNVMNQSPYPMVVCGDLNDVPNSYAYNTVGKGLDNAFAKKGSGIGKTFDGISPTLRIDNIFCSPSLRVHQCTTGKKRLSDHFPVVADLSIDSE